MSAEDTVHKAAGTRPPPELEKHLERASAELKESLQALRDTD